MLAVFVNMSLRGVTLLSRFLVLFALAYFLPVEQVGIYGLFVAAITYSLYLLGLDFYTFANREMVGVNAKAQNWMALSQFKFYCLTYCVFAMPLASVFAFGFVSWKFAALFYLILFFEHISQELLRLLVVLERPLVGSFVLFLRSASWAYVLLPLFYFLPESRSLEVVFYAWGGAAAFSVLAGFWALPIVGWGSLWKIPVNWVWVRHGLVLSIPFLLSTLALRFMFSADRYLLEWKGGLALVGVYTFYMGICNALQAFLDASVFQFMYPRLVRSANNDGAMNVFLVLCKRLVGQVIGVISVALIAMWLLIDAVVEMVGKLEYLNYLHEFWWLVLATIVLIISYVPHYVLYAKRYDKWIFIAHGASLIAFLVAVTVLSFASPMMFIAAALLCAFSTGCFIKVLGVAVEFRNFYDK